MIAVYPGHRYHLDNLKAAGYQELQFRQDSPRHPEVDGTSCQEVIRALIDRVQVLDHETPWFGNALIIRLLRTVLALFESRALQRKVEKNELDIELLPVGLDGHLIFELEPTWTSDSS